ncbi:uncharacterized protein LOC142340737 [Convolutriloba macropyga]|uniref:uncharacterized protein LOC142340737 n=1 Tax=Convolutriloba macropyga TaxID=536237 RepID=UPI003F51EEB2
MSETQPLINSHDFPPCYQGRAPVRTRWLGRLSTALMVALTFLWVFRYLGGVGLSPTVTGPGVNTTDVIFNWHPLLMCIAFPVLMGEALIAYKAPLCFADKAPRELKKKLHIILHCLALVLVIIAVIAVFKSHSLKQPAPTPDLYSLHSWLGILTLSVLGQQVCLSADIAGIRVLT